MTDADEHGHEATGRGEPQPVATHTNSDYDLSIEEVAERYAHAGHPRTIRTLQRYCVSGHLDCRKVAMTYGDKFLVAPYSVARHIAQVNEIATLTRSSTGRDRPRPVATDVAGAMGATASYSVTDEGATTGDLPRPAAASADTAAAAQGREVLANTRYVETLERENGFLRDQIGRKDTQIAELSERARETNFLIKGLQDLFLRLQPGQSEPRRVEDPLPGESRAGEAPAS